MTDLVTFYPALDAKQPGLVFESRPGEVTIGWCPQLAAGQGSAKPDDVAEHGGMLVTMRGATGQELTLHFVGKNDYSPPAEIYILDVFERFRPRKAASGSLTLKPGQHLLIPRDASAQAGLQDMLMSIDRLPPDVARGMYSAIRRPSLEWRLDQLERSLASGPRWPRFARGNVVQLLAAAVVLAAACLAGGYWLGRGAAQTPAVQSGSTAAGESTKREVASAAPALSPALEGALKKAAELLDKSSDQRVRKLASDLVSEDKRTVADAVLRMAAMPVDSNGAAADSPIRTAILKWKTGPEAELFAYLACRADGRAEYRIAQAGYFPAASCDAVKEPGKAAELISAMSLAVGAKADRKPAKN